MATGTRLMQEISDQFLNCKICFENFREPKTLSCLHTFCCTCLQQQYDQETLNRTSRYSIYNRQVTCPLCRKKTDLPTGGVRRLPENFLVSNLTEVVAKRTVSKVPPCEICFSVRAKNVDACSKCLDCTKLLCKGCVDLHLATKVTQQHSLIDLEGEKDIQCKVHPDENVRFYCEPCDACICVVCAFQEHKDHEVCSFSDGSVKYRSSLEGLLGKCKERLGQVSSRLHRIDKYETAVKDVRETIRDLAISYIAQVRAKEKELMKHIDDLYGGEIKSFIDQKPQLQENLDELQSTCNLTDIMLKDKGVELLLIKKEIESKMVQLLEPPLLDMPSDPKYDVRFVPGDVALGRLSFGLGMNEADDDKEERCLINKGWLEESKLINGCSMMSSSNDPDVITNCTQTERARTKEEATSMMSDMKTGPRNCITQTDQQGCVSRDTSTNQVETRERGVLAFVYDVKAKGTMTERSDVRSLKCQTDRSALVESEISVVADDVNSTVINDMVALPKRPISDQNSNGCLRQVNSNNVHSKHPNPRADVAPVPDLLPSNELTSSYTYTPGRRIRSIKIQTEISSLDINASTLPTDQQFIQSLVQAENKPDKSTQDSVKTPETPSLRERLRRARGAETETTKDQDMTHSAVPSPAPREVNPAAASGDLTTRQRRHAAQLIHSGTTTERGALVEKSTSTVGVTVTDKDTSTPVVTKESKVTWTEKMSTSDRATCTVGVKVQDRATGTMAVKASDFGAQVSPQANLVSTNTPVIYHNDHESQTAVETSDQGTVPDTDIENMFSKKEVTSTLSVALDSSADFVTPPQSPVKCPVKLCDKSCDPIKTPSFSKATETVKVKSVNSATETTAVKYADKDTATSVSKTVDQWTETISPQMVSTGVTPPVPSTIDVGVATTHVITDDQATCTDIKAFRDSHTETVVVVCDNETLTDVKSFSDAQTAIEIQTENQECETFKLDNADEYSMTDNFTSFDDECTENSSTQSDAPVLCHSDTNTRRPRRRAREVQTSPAPCPFCGIMNQIGERGEAKKMSSLPDNSSINKAFRDSCTEPQALGTQDVGTMAISCVTCHHEFQEAAIQTSEPQLYDKASAASFDLDQDFLERALSRQYHDAATSTESLPYIGLLSEIDVDELIVVPEAAFELVSDTDSEFDHYDVIMVDDETSTDFLQYVESGTQTFVSSEDPASGTDSVSTSMTESTGSKSVGEVIRSLVLKDGFRMDGSREGEQSKHFVSIGVNTLPKLTFEKETCTPIRHLFSKGTMTFYVSKMDKSTSTLNQARILTGSTLTKTKSVDKITMTSRADQKDMGTETEPTTMDGKITACISKLRNVSERLNSPPAKKAGELFFGKTFGSSAAANETSDMVGSPKAQRSLFSVDDPEERRQKQLRTLLEQTNAMLKPKDPSPIRKPQPITTLKCRKPASASSVTDVTSVTNSLKPEERCYDSKSLPRGFPSDRPGTVRMGSQPLSPSRLPLLRYNSAPGRIATVPAQTLLNKSNQANAKVCRSASPSKIPITKKMSPPEYVVKPQQADAKPQEMVSPKPQMRRPLPSITETRTPSSCSDTSTASGTSAAGSSFAPNRLSTDSSAPNSYRISTESSVISDANSPPLSLSNRVSMDSSVTVPSRSPSTNTSLSMNSDSFSDTVFTKSSSEVIQSTGSTETLEDKTSTDEKSPKKSGIGFMQRFLSKKKKVPEEKKREPVSVIKSGPTTASAVAALATATPPLPTPAPESHALANPQFPPHHYPPPPEHKTPPPPRKPRPFVYVRQRIFSIQQDNVEDVEEKKVKDKIEDPTSEVNKADVACAKEGTKVKDKEKISDKPKEKSKKEEKTRPEKEKKKEGDKEKTKTKTMKVKSKKVVEKGSTGSKKDVGGTEADPKT